MAVKIRKDGGVDLGPDAKTATYSVLPDENGAIITRRGEPWRRVRVKDDVKKGVMTVTVTSESKGNEKPRVEIHRCDPLTGELLGKNKKDPGIRNQ